MKYILNLIYLLVLLLMSPKIMYRLIKHGRYRNGWDERLGKIRRKNAKKKCVWIHAVSVGEVNATKTLVESLQNKLPDFDIAISATTDTGYERAKKLYADSCDVFYFPFDISFIMERAFRYINPAVSLLMELELWPNMTAEAKKKNVPIVVVNGRISDRSFPRYKKIKPLVHKTFRCVNLFLAQSDEYAERFIALGGKKNKTIVTGSLKYDTAEISAKIAGSDELAELLDIGKQRILVAGGTGPGEEKIILKVFKQLLENSVSLKLVIVPRKPERFGEVAETIKNYGFETLKLSNAKAANKPQATDSNTVILGDTIGDLRKFYCMAEIVFVGRTMVAMGGSDMIEPAALGKFTVFGKHTFNFKQTVKALLDGNGAVRVATQQELFDTIYKAAKDRAWAEKIASNGQNVIRQNQGATEKSVNLIVKLLRDNSKVMYTAHD